MFIKIKLVQQFYSSVETTKAEAIQMKPITGVPQYPRFTETRKKLEN
jgi:hypothetical protein